MFAGEGLPVVSTRGPNNRLAKKTPCMRQGVVAGPVFTADALFRPWEMHLCRLS